MTIYDVISVSESLGLTGDKEVMAGVYMSAKYNGISIWALGSDGFRIMDAKVDHNVIYYEWCGNITLNTLTKDVLKEKLRASMASIDNALITSAKNSIGLSKIALENIIGSNMK